MQLLLSRSNTILEVAHLMKVIKRDRYYASVVLVRVLSEFDCRFPQFPRLLPCYLITPYLFNASLPATLNAPLSAGRWKSQTSYSFRPPARRQQVCLVRPQSAGTVAGVAGLGPCVHAVRFLSPLSPLSSSGISFAPTVITQEETPAFLVRGYGTVFGYLLEVPPEYGRCTFAVD
jgi:hypothetical protein